jgi:glycosyltransferase involved in cell wall biosynthesis
MIADVAFPFLKGGAQRRQFEVGRRLAKRGWKVDLLAYQSWDGPAVLEANGIRYIGLGASPSMYNSSGKRSKTEPIDFFLRVCRKLPLLKEYDVIWASQWPMTHLLPVAVYCRLRGLRLVIDWFEVWGSLWIKYSKSVGWIGLILERLLLRLGSSAGALVTDSALEERKIRAVVGDRDDIYFISNGIPKDEIGVLPTGSERRFHIGCLGRLKAHKSVDLLIRAVKHIEVPHGGPVTVAIVGDGPERESLEELASQLGVTEQITFFGLIPNETDVYRIMKDCCLSVITTIGGGAGNLTVLESFGCGLPVVAFRCYAGMDPELIQHGKTGIWVDEISPEALASELSILLSDRGLLAKMWANVRDESRDLDWASITTEYESVLESRAHRDSHTGPGLL